MTSRGPDRLAENLGFAIPVTYVKDFLRNREAFSFDKDNPNTGYRYLDPPRRLRAGRPPGASRVLRGSRDKARVRARTTGGPDLGRQPADRTRAALIEARAAHARRLNAGRRVAGPRRLVSSLGSVARSCRGSRVEPRGLAGPRSLRR